MAADERRQIRAIVRGLEQVTERITVKITLDALANLVQTTPVDIGWAKNNWIPSATVAVERDLSGVTPNPAAAAAEQALGTAKVLGFKLQQGRTFINNNVPYINRLNHGHSQQAPSGFVQRAIVKALTTDNPGAAAAGVRIVF